MITANIIMLSLLRIKVQYFYYHMIKINYPPYRPKIKSTEAGEIIFDEVRRRWVNLTPEEWVRQNFLQYLLQVKNYQAGLIAVEKEIDLGELKKRFDIVVYKNAMPWMIVECKDTSVSLNQKVLDQVLRYNITLKVPYLVITNGHYCYAFSMEENKLKELEELPD